MSERLDVEQQVSERELVEAEQFRLLVESVQDYAIFLLDPEGRVVSWNRGAQRIKGYAPDEILGTHFSVFYTEEDQRRGHPRWELVVAAKQGHYTEEGLRVRKDGSVFPAHVTITALRTETGELVGFAKVTHDITEQQRAAELRESERRFRELAENIREVIWVSDPDFTHVFYVNPAYEAIWGRSAESLYREPMSFLEAVFQDDRARALALMERLRDGQATAEFRILRPNGELRWISVRAFPIEDQDGALGRVVGISEDVTARKEIEAERARLLEREREARQRVTGIMESITDAFFALDRAWRFADANREAERLFGTPKGELLGRTLWDVFPEAVGTLCQTEYHRVMNERVSVSFEQLFGERWFESRAFPSPEGIVVYLQNITRRKRAEAAQRLLAEASAMLAGYLDYRAMLPALAHLVVPAIADFCLVDILAEDGSSQRLAAVHRDPTNEELMQVLRRFPPPPMSPSARALRGGEPVLIEEVSERDLATMSATDAHRRHILATGVRSVIFAPLVARGRALGVITLGAAEPGRSYGPEDLALARDLATRAAFAVDNARLYVGAEEARAEAERRARQEAALRRAADEVNAAFTEEDVIRQIAQSALDATGADGAWVERMDLGRNELAVVTSAGRRVPAVASRGPYPGSYLERVVERAEPELVDDLSAASFWLSEDLAATCASCTALVVPLLDAGEPVGALFLIREAERSSFRPDEIQRAGTFGDLAALAFRKVHLLADAERKRDELERVMESRATLVRGFSHDVKNPLGAADGFLQLLEAGTTGQLTDKQEESVRRVRRSLRAALGLIEDLLDLARAEAGEIEIRWVPVSARDAASEVGEDHRAQAEEKGLTLDLVLPRQFPVIESDVVRVRQILGNLISNAIKYTPKGGHVWVSVGIRAGGDAPGPGRWVTVDVSDTGGGISEEQQKVLFQEFARLETSAGERGTGIGLAISRRVARALGGDVTAKSDVGVGSTFTLWLPLASDARSEGADIG